MTWIQPDRLRRIATALGLALIPVALFAVHLQLQREFDTWRALRASIDETIATRERLSQLVTLHLDIETGMRGYLLTRDDAFLAPYRQARREREMLLDQLRPHFAVHHGHRALFSRLEAASDAKARFSAARIAEARSGRIDTAAQVVATGDGARLTETIRRNVAALDAAENAHLEVMGGERNSTRNTLERSVALILACLALFLAGIAWLVGRTMRQRSEALARAERLSQSQAAMFDGGVDGMMLLDARGYILRINPSVVRMFGYDPSELVGQHNTELMARPFDLDTSQAWLDRVGQAGVDGAGSRQEFIGRRKDGTTFATEVAVSRISEGGQRRYVAAIRDITAFKRAEQMKNEFVSTVSHELRTPLTSIAGSLGLLTSGAVGPLNAKAGRLVGIAHSNCERLIRLINDILDIEKIESGKMHFTEGEVDIGALIEWTVAANRAMAEDHHVVLVAATPAERVLVRGDTDRLEQLLTNLVSNAIKHSPEGETVEIVATAGSARIAIDVMDRGGGIPHEFRGRIFGKFAMADTSDTRTKGGTGLGLSIAQEIAHRHGGSILFQDRPGGGTVFRTELPVLAHVEQARKSARRLPRILHVDDDRDCLSVVASAFDKHAEVLAVATLEEARRMIARTRIDGAILDVGLRDGNGGSLVPLLRRRDATLPVIVFTALDEPHGELAADAIMIKSRASLDDLVATTISLLGANGQVAA